MTRRRTIAFDARFRTQLSRPPIRLIIAALVIIPAIYAPIPFPYKVPVFAALALLATWLQSGSLSAAGLELPRRLVPTLLWALAAAVLVVVGVGEVLSPLISWIAGTKTDYSAYGALKGNFEAAMRLFLYALISAAIAEEIVYRGFLLDQLSAIFGGSTAAKAAAVVLGAIIFAIPHAFQGISGVATVAITGMIFGWVFFQSDRNLWAVMFAHALVDAWGIAMLYIGVT